MIKFEEYEKMILNRAHKVSRMYKYDYDECVGIGYEIYVNAVNKYDERKGAKFGTYLYIELNRMVDKVESELRNSKYEMDSVVDDDVDLLDNVSSSDEPDNSKLFKLAKQQLSYEAYRLFTWAVSFDWQDFSKTKVANIPTKKLAIKGCGFPKEIVESAWDECESFWNNVGWKVA